MVFYFAVSIFLAYEIHKILDFKRFNKLLYFISKYPTEIKNRKSENPITLAISKISLMNLFCIIILIIGSFSFQGYLFVTILVMFVIKESFLKNFNPNKILRTILFFTDSMITAILLIFIIVNYLYLNIDINEIVNTFFMNYLK